MSEQANSTESTAAVDADRAALQRDGYVVIPELLASQQIEDVHRELAPCLQRKLMGRNEFEGLCSERVYAVLAKAPSLAPLIEHPRLLGIVDQLLQPNYLLSAAIAINVHPGETAQAFHSDDGATRTPRPRPMFGVSAIWALDDFSETNGPTEVIPGSHRWDHAEPPVPDDPSMVPIVMPAGSVVVIAGSLFHRGGANRSDGTRLGFTPQYCEPWLRQIETMVLAVPPACARQYSVRIQELLGYSIAAPSFMGYVDGVHPRRLVDPDYRSLRTANAGVPNALRTR
jgi:ectoine hydroxylase-related dioxygenase (phytanoyl-CoA dioxygenase family)